MLWCIQDHCWCVGLNLRCVCRFIKTPLQNFLLWSTCKNVAFFARSPLFPVKCLSACVCSFRKELKKLKKKKAQPEREKTNSCLFLISPLGVDHDAPPSYMALNLICRWAGVELEPSMTITMLGGVWHRWLVEPQWSLGHKHVLENQRIQQALGQTALLLHF